MNIPAIDTPVLSLGSKHKIIYYPIYKDACNVLHRRVWVLSVNGKEEQLSHELSDITSALGATIGG